MLAMVATGPEYLPVDAMAGVKANLDHDKGTVLNLVLLEDPDVDPPCSGAMVESVWGRMPGELVERVLLFLPACSQARFRSVCKWWRELMTSFNFREETSSIALRRSRHPVCVLKCEALAHLMDESQVEQEAFELERVRNWFKVRKVEFPGLVLPPVLYWDSNVFTGADLPLVGVACREKESRHMRCWLLNVAERTWLELPRLLLPWDRVSSSLLVFWDFWLVSVPAAKGTDLRVLVLSGDLCLTYLHSYSSTSQEWRTTGYPRGNDLNCESYEAYVAESYLKIGRDKALIGEGRHIVIKLQEDGQKMLRLSLEGLQATCCMLPDLPKLDCSSPLSHSEGDAVFAYGPVAPSARACCPCRACSYTS